MKKILVVEDDEAVRRMIEKLLGSRDRDLRGAGTGREALLVLRDERPDLIVLDFFLPDMVAVSFMTQAREIYRGVPVIIVTNFWNMEYAKIAAREGAVAFVPKPIDPQQLMETVSYHLSGGDISWAPPSTGT